MCQRGRLRAAGLKVCLIDDHGEPGGSLNALPERAAALLARSPLDGVEVLTESEYARSQGPDRDDDDGPVELEQGDPD